jgi:selenocysteine insertion sequence-binding protein 2
MKGDATAHSDDVGIGVPPVTRPLRQNSTARNSDEIPADSRTSSKQQEQRVSYAATGAGVTKSKLQKREAKRPNHVSMNVSQKITSPSSKGRHPGAPPRNAGAGPSMPAPKVLLKKPSTNSQRFSLQASAPEFVPHFSASSVVSPFGMASWPSLPNPTRSAPEMVPPPPQQHPRSNASPFVTTRSPPVDDVCPSGSRPLSTARVVSLSTPTNGVTTDSPSHPKMPLTNSLPVSKAAPVIEPPHPPNTEGSHFELLRLFQEGKLTAQKGRQRVTPRKKKFSSLKKKVLDERLRQWKSLQGIPETDEAVRPDSNDASESFCSTLCVYGYCTRDELSEDDEYDEIVDNLQDMASKIGATKRVFVPRQGSYDKDHWPVFVQFEESSEGSQSAAIAAVRCWTGLVLGGQTLSCRPLPNLLSDETNLDDEIAWRNACLTMEASWTVNDMDQETVADAIASTTMLLDNALTEEDLDDEDCLAESLSDIRSIASKFGEVESLQVQLKDDVPTTQLRIVFRGDARGAVSEMNQVVIGGQQLVAILEKDGFSSPRRSFCVRLLNIITDDDLEDDACLEESLNDVRELAGRFGRVENVNVDKPSAEDKIHDPREYSIQLFFSTLSEAQSAAAEFDGMVVGGSCISAAIDNHASAGWEGDVLALNDIVKDNGREPMYSGDKLVPERFAECKRALKVAGRTSARPYAKLASDETIKTTIIEMLSELMRLQRRALEENNVKAKRRLVMGLREVARGIRSHKVKLVVMANNLDEYGVIDATVQSIIDLAQKEEVPIYYELNKKALGKAVGKSIKVAVVGVQSPEGAHQQYKKLISYASNLG